MPKPTPIKLAILWHQHQPYYRAGTKFILPWVWLHATKDYLEMAQHLEQVPKMRATVNLVPSLIKQIEEYLSGSSTDPVLYVMRKPSNSLTQKEKEFILQNFFHANEHTMISRSTRYRELYDISHSQNAVSRYSEGDLRDLVIHYALAWTGEFVREREPFARLIAQDRDFSESDKHDLMAALEQAVREIIPLHKKLADSGQIELTTTPFYHPIMPLVYDTETALEANPQAVLPRTKFAAPEDVEKHLKRARDMHEDRFSNPPNGVWPSEGSLSAPVLGAIRKQGFAWTATDEAVLERSLNLSTDDPTIDTDDAKFFPWKYETPYGPIAIFFRDHALSDNIGFTYQSWGASDAVSDFITHVKTIREHILEQYGEEKLASACVSVILDGENCWEYYPENGKEFLSGLYTALTQTEEIDCVTFSSALDTIGLKNLPELKTFVAGSWINANFNIWLGHPEDNVAWDLLAHAKRTFEEFRSRTLTLSGKLREDAGSRLALAEEELLIAEGSDWCWWYGDEHYSAQKHEFDELYRMHLRSMYVHLDHKVPLELSVPVPDHADLRFYAERMNQRHVRVPEKRTVVVPLEKKFGAMHKSSRAQLTDLHLTTDGKEIQISIGLSTTLKRFMVQIVFHSPAGLVVLASSTGASVRAETAPAEIAVRATWGDVIEVALPHELLLGTKRLAFALHILGAKSSLIAQFPEQGFFEVDLPE